MITPFLKNAQNQNNQAVNDTLNQLFLDSEDHESLRHSVTNYENIDQLSLAKATEYHELTEFRRISAYLYRRNQKFKQSIELSKKDRQYRDAIETSQESGDEDLIRDLLEFFIEIEDKEFFTVCLYTCYDYLSPDIVMELTYRFGLYEYAMPYFVQTIKDLTVKVDKLQSKNEVREKREEKAQEQQMSQPPMIDIYQDLGFMMPNQPMLPGPDGFNPGGGMGGGMGSNFGGPPMITGPSPYGDRGFSTNNNQNQPNRGGYGGPNSGGPNSGFGGNRF